MGYWDTMRREAAETAARMTAEGQPTDPQEVFADRAGTAIESALWSNGAVYSDTLDRQRYKLAAQAGLVAPGVKRGEIKNSLDFARGGVVPKGRKKGCYADGGAVPSIGRRAEFAGPGGPRDDAIPVKVAGSEIQVSDGEQALILPAKTAANPQAIAAIGQIIAASNDGQAPNMGTAPDSAAFAKGGTVPDEDEDKLRPTSVMNPNGVAPQVLPALAEGPVLPAAPARSAIRPDAPAPKPAAPASPAPADPNRAMRFPNQVMRAQYDAWRAVPLPAEPVRQAIATTESGELVNLPKPELNPAPASLSAVRDTTTFPTTPKPAPAASAPAPAPKAARPARAPAPAAPSIAEPPAAAPDPSGIKFIAYGTNETQSTGAPRSIGRIYQQDGSSAPMVGGVPQAARDFTARSAAADRADPGQPVELVTANGRAILDPQHGYRAVPVDVAQTGRSGEYFAAQGQAAIDAQQDPLARKLANEQQIASIHAGPGYAAAAASRYGHDVDATVRREALKEPRFDARTETSVDPATGERTSRSVPVPVNQAAIDFLAKQPNAGSSATVPTFQTTAELRAAIKAGKVKKGDVVNTPDGQIRVK